MNLVRIMSEQYRNKNLPCSVLKFAVKSSIDMLPTFTNISKWGKRTSVNFQLCVKQTLFHVVVHCKYILDQGRLTWSHNSVLNHIAGCLKSALVGKSTVELYCDLDGLHSMQAPGGRSILADIMVQAQRPDLVVIDRSLHGRHRIALVELTSPWDTDTKRAKERKTTRYADLKIALSNEAWDCSLYLIEVGARGHNIKSVKDRLRSLFRG
jgi:hypothetical protein